MTDNKWDDSKIEKLLRAMPDLQDNRPESEVLVRLKQDERLHVPRKQKQKRWMPVLVAVAALLIIGILVPSMLRQNDGAMMNDASEQMATSESEDISVKDSSAEERALFNEEMETEEATTFSMTEMGAASYALLPDDLVGMRPFRVGLTYAAEVIPVTFLLPNQRIETDFPGVEPDSVALYNRYATEFPETELGFDDYHPYKGELTLMDDVIVHTIPVEHPYDMSSATEGVYVDTVLETFNDHPSFKTVDGYGDLAEFSHTGVTRPITLLGGKRPMPYYKYTMPTGQSYLVPAGGRDFDSVEEALAGMKEQQSDLFESVIPEAVTYDVREENGLVVITFDHQLDLSGLDPVEATAMIEGFMLTARNFDKQVRLENSVQEQFGKYDLTSALPEPIGANPIPFPG